MTHYFLFAGEPSGDLHGSKLALALSALDPLAQFSGIAGPLMRSVGVTGPLKMENFQVMGFSDVLKALPRLWKSFYIVRDAILMNQPDVVILIDYPGFNLRLAKALRKKNFTGKIVQYIAPTIWAHGKQRIKSMSKTLDLLLTIYPFEKAYFSHTNLKVEYIGNPLMDNFKNWRYNQQWRTDIGLEATAEIIALFPGSREGEIRRHTPLQLQAASLLAQKFPFLKFAVSYANLELFTQIQSEVNKTSLQIGHNLFFVPPEYRYELMHDCQIALAKSGTVTLELALHRKPSVVIYQLSQLNYLIAKYLLRLKLSYYCMVNILGQREIYPELIGVHIQAESIQEKITQLHQSKEKQQGIIEACEQVIQLLAEKRETHQAAAHAIQELLK